MPNVNDIYPSKYLKAGDLKGREITAKMSGVQIEKLGDDSKPILYFQNAEKGLALNKTNAMLIAGIYGDNTDIWIGQAITLYSAWVDFRGQQVQAIRVKMPMQMQQALQPNGGVDSQVPLERPVGGMGAVAGQQSENPAAGTAPNFADELDDSIPFAPERR